MFCSSLNSENTSRLIWVQHESGCDMYNPIELEPVFNSNGCIAWQCYTDLLPLCCQAFNTKIPEQAPTQRHMCAIDRDVNGRQSQDTMTCVMVQTSYLKITTIMWCRHLWCHWLWLHDRKIFHCWIVGNFSQWLMSSSDNDAQPFCGFMWHRVLFGGGDGLRSMDTFWIPLIHKDVILVSIGPFC